MFIMTFTEVDILNRTAANVVLGDLHLNFQGQTFRVAILTKYLLENANISTAVR